MLITGFPCKQENKRVAGGRADTSLPIAAELGMNISSAIFLKRYEGRSFYEIFLTKV